MATDINEIAALLLARRDSLFRAIIENCGCETNDLSLEIATTIADSVAKDYETTIKDVLVKFGWAERELALTDAG